MRAIGHSHSGNGGREPVGTLVLPHEERALRRKLVTLEDGREVLIDLPRTVMFGTGDLLVLESGDVVQIIAAQEPLYKLTGLNDLHLAQLCWHIGNRHFPCEIVAESGRPAHILIAREKVIGEMLEGLGAVVEEVTGPFSPLGGAYGDHGSGHGHHHSHG